MIRACLLMILAGCTQLEVLEIKPVNWISDTSTLPAGPVTPHASIVDHYRDTATKIIAAARADHVAYRTLAELTDTIGHRLSGSPELDRAIAWATRVLSADGLAVHTEKVMVPHWVRGAEDATIVTPIERPLHVIGLGGSVGTPKGGIAAPVVVVHDWAELDAKRDAVKGAIVVYDVKMPAWSEAKGSGYGEVVEFRTEGAIRAAKLGAVAMLVRSVTAHSLHTPHTGAMRYDDKAAKIPAAAITVEDAELLDRLAAKGAVSVRMHLDEQQLADVESANVIAELRGKDKPDEIVVIGAHLDSWDVGQGAHDDGAGVVTMIEAAHLLAKLELVPRRTIRVVLFTNEENGLRGGKDYAQRHAGELAKTVLALESDSGGFEPRGFSVGHSDAAAQKRMRARVEELASLVRAVGVTHVNAGHGGSDIAPMAPAGVPQLGLEVDNRTYFDIHHTEADTLDKVDPAQLADDVAAVAVLAYVVADLPDRIDAQ